MKGTLDCVSFSRPDAPRLNGLFANFKNKRRSQGSVTINPLSAVLSLVAEDNADTSISISARVGGKGGQRNGLNDCAPFLKIGE